MLRTRIACAVAAAVACGMMTGCMMTGSYHSAKTLEPGTSNFGLTFGINTFQSDSGPSVTLPNPIPELTFHTGVAKNLELGGRIAIASMGLEGDFKYRFLKAGKLHLAMAPAIGYQGLLVLKGVTFGLPIIGTIDMSRTFALSGAGFARYAHYSAGDSTLGAAVKEIVGDALMFGGAFGPEITGETFFFRPMVEFARVVPVGDAIWSGRNRLSVAVHLGWIMGREKQQLDRIEKKIDKIDKKLDEPGEERKAGE